MVTKRKRKFVKGDPVEQALQIAFGQLGSGIPLPLMEIPAMMKEARALMGPVDDDAKLGDIADRAVRSMQAAIDKFRLDRFTVTVTQMVESLSDPDDKVDLPAGADGYGSRREYPVPPGIASEEGALDWFHHNVPIGCLEDFAFECVWNANRKLHGGCLRADTKWSGKFRGR